MSRLLHRTAGLVLAALLSWPALASAQVATGSFNVLVTRAGVAVESATVCVGVANDLNQFFQGVTNAQGRVAFATVPPVPFVITANGGGRGSQASFSPASTAFFTTQIALPASGGPSCPTTPAGPARTLVSGPTGFVLPTTPTFQGITLTNTQFCFGALGAECGHPQFSIPTSALCANGHCLVNGGSWSHDECCFAHPKGMACQAGPLDALTGHDGNCVAEWDKALRLVIKGLNWQRDVNFQSGNTTGTVVFNQYCAPVDTLLPPADAQRCCSRLSRALTAAESGIAALKFETLVACR